MTAPSVTCGVGATGSYGEGTGSYGDGRGYEAYESPPAGAIVERVEFLEWQAERGPYRLALVERAVDGACLPLSVPEPPESAKASRASGRGGMKTGAVNCTEAVRA